MRLYVIWAVYKSITHYHRLQNSRFSNSRAQGTRASHFSPQSHSSFLPSFQTLRLKRRIRPTQKYCTAVLQSTITIARWLDRVAI